MGTHTAESLSIKLALDRLSSLGFDRALCETALASNANNEDVTLRALIKQLIAAASDPEE
ncbi:hypothetical protein SARC_11097, partial [Sphaeroforma arctica JP610]